MLHLFDDLLLQFVDLAVALEAGFHTHLSAKGVAVFLERKFLRHERIFAGE